MDYGSMHYVTVPYDIATRLLSESKRFLVTFDQSDHIHCTIHRKDEGYYIMLGKHFKSIVGVDTGQEVEVQIEIDNSEYGAPMPIELEECIAIDPDGAEIFYNLSDGRKRSAMFFVNKAKAEATRIKRALLILENLKLGITDPQKFTRRQK